MFITNLAIYKDIDLREDMELYRYDLKENRDYSLLGKIVRYQRNKNHRNIIFQLGLSIFAYYPLQLSNNEDELFKSSHEIINCLSRDGRLLLRHYIGEAIATHIRTLGTKWRAGAVRPNSLIYYARELGSIDPDRKFHAWRGFRYSPVVFEEGYFGVIIDPKFKLYTSMNLKQILQQIVRKKGFDSISNLTKNERQQIEKEFISPLKTFHGEVKVNDVCPEDSCPHKRDPFSPCKLSDDGKVLTLIGLDWENTVESYYVEPPANNSSSKKMDLIEYHNHPEICIKNMLGDLLDKNMPLAIVKMQNKETKYRYPLERLREIPTFAVLKREDRQELMRLLQPVAEDRFQRSQEIVRGELLNFKIGNKIVSFDKFSDMASRNIYSIEPPKLCLHNEYQTKYPIRDLGKIQPFDYDSRGFNYVHIYIIFAGEEFVKHNDTLFHIKDIIESGQEKYILSFKDTFSITDVNIELIKRSLKTVEEVKIEIEKLNKIANEHEKKIFLIVYNIFPIEDSFILNKWLIENRIPAQGMNLETLKETLDVSTKLRGYLRNIYLGLYAKMGGQVWTLPVGLIPNNYLFLGYSSQVIEGKINYCLTLIDHRGRLLASYFDIATAETYIEHLEKTFNDIITDHSQNKNLIIHVNGRLYPKIELPAIEEVMANLNKSTFVLEFIPSPIRLYQETDLGIRSAPAGTIFRISSDEYSILTYYFTRQQGVPDPLVIRRIRGSRNQFREQVIYAFYLTQSYTGYMWRQIKLPLSVHSAVEILNKCVSYKVHPGQRFETPWFI